MGERKRTIIVTAYDDPQKPDGVWFKMAGYGVKNDEIKCSKDNKWEPMKQTESHSVRFELANRSSINLRFPSDKTRAMWVGPDGGGCPQQTTHQDAVVCATAVSADELTVQNFNQSKGAYKFSLNFVDADAADESHLIPFDPIWNNQNGGSP